MTNYNNNNFNNYNNNVNNISNTNNNINTQKLKNTKRRSGTTNEIMLKVDDYMFYFRKRR